MERYIRNSAKALVIRENQLLAVQIEDADGKWYVLPGGGQEPGECLEDTVCREVAEEAGLRVKAEELAFVVEGLHGESFHRVDLVFLCRYLGEIPDAVLQADTNQTGFAWLDIAQLNTLPLYPSKLRRQIMNLWEGKPYRVYLGNEEIGDPECLD